MEDENLNPVIDDTNAEESKLLKASAPSLIGEPSSTENVPLVTLLEGDESATGVSSYGDQSGHENFNSFNLKDMTSTAKAALLNKVMADTVLQVIPFGKEEIDTHESSGIKLIPQDETDTDRRKLNYGVFSGIQEDLSVTTGMLHRRGVSAIVLMGDPAATDNQFDANGAYVGEGTYKATRKHRMPPVYFNAIKFAVGYERKLRSDLKVKVTTNHVYLIRGIRIPTKSANKTFDDATYLNSIKKGYVPVDGLDPASGLQQVVTPNADLFDVVDVTPVITDFCRNTKDISEFVSAIKSRMDRNYEMLASDLVHTKLRDTEVALQKAKAVADNMLYCNQAFPNNSLFDTIYDNNNGKSALSCKNNVGSLVKAIKDMTSLEFLPVQSAPQIARIRDRMEGTIITEGGTKTFPFTQAKFSPYKEGEQYAWLDGVAAANQSASQPSRLYNTLSGMLYNANELYKMISSFIAYIQGNKGSLKYISDLFIPSEAVENIKEDIRRLQSLEAASAADNIDVSEARDINILYAFNPNELIQWKATITTTNVELKDKDGNTITVPTIQPDNFSFSYAPTCGFVLTELDNTNKLAKSHSTVYEILPDVLVAWCEALSDEEWVRNYLFGRNNRIRNYTEWCNSFLSGAMALAKGSGSVPDHITLPMSFDINKFSFAAYLLCAALYEEKDKTDRRFNAFKLLARNANEIVEGVGVKGHVSAVTVLNQVMDSLIDNQESNITVHGSQGKYDPVAYNKRYEDKQLHQFAMYGPFSLPSGDATAAAAHIPTGTKKLAIFAPALNDDHLEHFGRFTPLNMPGNHNWKADNKRELVETILRRAQDTSLAELHFAPVSAETSRGYAVNPLLINGYYSILTKGTNMEPVFFARTIGDPNAEPTKAYSYRPIISGSVKKIAGGFNNEVAQLYGKDGFQYNPIGDVYVMVVQSSKSVIAEGLNTLHADRFIGGIADANIMMCPAWIIPGGASVHTTASSIDKNQVTVKQPVYHETEAPGFMIKANVAESFFDGTEVDASGCHKVDTSKSGYDHILDTVNLVCSEDQCTTYGRLAEYFLEPSLYGYRRRALTPVLMPTRVSKSVTYSGHTYCENGFHLTYNDKILKEKNGYLTDESSPYYEPFYIAVPHLARLGDSAEAASKVNNVTDSIEARVSAAFNFDKNAALRADLVRYTPIYLNDEYDQGHTGSYANQTIDYISKATQRILSPYNVVTIDGPDEDSNQVRFLLTAGSNRDQYMSVSGIETTVDDMFNYLTYVGRVEPEIKHVFVREDVMLITPNLGDIKLKILGEYNSHLNPKLVAKGAYAPMQEVVLEGAMYFAREDAFAPRQITSRFYSYFMKEAETNEGQ